MRTNTCVSYLAKSSLALASASADGAADAVAFRGFASAALVDGVQIAHPLRLARSANVSWSVLIVLRPLTRENGTRAALESGEADR